MQWSAFGTFARFRQVQPLPRNGVFCRGVASICPIWRVLSKGIAARFCHFCHRHKKERREKGGSPRYGARKRDGLSRVDAQGFGLSDNKAAGMQRTFAGLILTAAVDLRQGGGLFGTVRARAREGLRCFVSVCPEASAPVSPCRTGERRQGGSGCRGKCNFSSAGGAARL